MSYAICHEQHDDTEKESPPMCWEAPVGLRKQVWTFPNATPNRTREDLELGG